MFGKQMKSVFVAGLLAASPALMAQSTPGTITAAADVSADIKTMFTLAAEKYPTIFVNGSDWRSYSGFIYRFFPSSGVYAGVKDGQVYLMGGVFGPSLTPKASVAAATAALNAMPAPAATASAVAEPVSAADLQGTRLNATGYIATTAAFQEILKAETKPSLNAVYIYGTSPTAGILGRTVRKFDYEGKQDTSYGTAGSLTINSNELEQSYSGFAVDGLGRAYVVGASNGAAITRYNAQGTIDSSFGSNGRLSLTAAGIGLKLSVLQLRTAIALADDSILLAGNAYSLTTAFTENQWVVIHLKADGTLNPSFGTGGVASVKTGTNDSPALINRGGDGSIYLTGKTADTASVVFKFNGAGKLDESFGTAGKASFGTGSTTTIHDVAIDSSGALFGIGTQSPGTVKQGLVSKLTAAGKADTSYGTAGKAIVNYYEIFPGSDSYNDELTNGWFDQDGKLMVGGMAYQTGTKADYLTVSRLNTDGSVDTSFNDRTDVTRAERVTFSSYAVDLTWDYPGVRAPVFPNPTGTHIVTLGVQANTRVYSFMRWK